MPKFLSRRSLLAAAAALSLSAGGAFAQQNQVIRIGVTPGPHAEIAEQIKPLLAKKGYDLKIFEFSDFVIPNQALDTGDLEANAFQHQPYLDNQVKDRGFKIFSAATTVNFPMGIYSQKYKSWAELPDGVTVSIQNDPTNGGRALLLLQDNGVIKLKPGTGFKPTVLDITENPKKLKIIEIEAGQTVRSLADVAAAAINTSYAVDAKIDPNSAILREEPKGPYTNLIAVRAADKDKPFVQALVESYRSPEIKTFVADRFKGSILPSW
ncbi:DL-methionine transporter subunit; periplasmic-binding component of ABC superfamily [Bosea sp. 62]|uniref:MetQ/NlpA family ABC transporter substrate-binding protein n=1 Tax=unclassified Bosea (in: a-proteobacteria) TaxID=2653178 RepID=UPI00125AA868|nr:MULTISPECIES: MetQ/NlpA family ABC transporter substrate-binding protein [unclassified Bosea (in: a-proteobacteria)]CAD5287135.1 DL-methionine transporter subunit; periplasmic-binding component of ABC superfamily [Bosea sp. 21B]CAD5289505.1 DL-methionine transporter subunit; periplasmic-binding component of ABC superfamily [Bosea sp. 46]CAD5301136.1 DL-methionine transporter subunit; periplasmic-binding component of ABC superfamily [Bosea sp. 7B]VVT60497.1 DL-methionine transporter subunit; 